MAKNYEDEYEVVWNGSMEASWTFGRGSLLHPREEWRHRNFELFCEDKKKKAMKKKRQQQKRRERERNEKRHIA